jgi:hypothetical protein
MNKKTLFVAALVVAFSLITIGNLTAQSQVSYYARDTSLETGAFVLDIKSYEVIELRGTSFHEYALFYGQTQEARIMMAGSDGVMTHNVPVKKSWEADFTATFTRSGNIISVTYSDGEVGELDLSGWTKVSSMDANTFPPQLLR